MLLIIRKIKGNKIWSLNTSLYVREQKAFRVFLDNEKFSILVKINYCLVSLDIAALSVFTMNLVTTTLGLCLCFPLDREESLWQVYRSECGQAQRQAYSKRICKYLKGCKNPTFSLGKKEVPCQTANEMFFFKGFNCLINFNAKGPSVWNVV